jgi:Zn-dependent metalloprotease
MKKLVSLAALLLVLLSVIYTAQNGASANSQEDKADKALAKQQKLVDRLARAEALSREHLSRRLGEYGIKDTSELKTKRVFEDDLLMTHTHVQQLHEGVPVFGAEAIVHLNADGSVFETTDKLAKFVRVSTQPSLSQEEAIKTAINEYGCDSCLTAEPAADLWVLRAKGRDELVYRVQLRREDGSLETALPVYFVDAHTGEIAWSYNNLQTASGVSLYSGTVSINTYFSSSAATYYMEDLSRRVGTFDNRNTTTSTYRFADSNDIWDSTSQRAGVDAHYGAEKFYDYFLNVHGRRGIDGSGGPGYYTAADGVTPLISSKVHYGVNYNNAFWNGSFMTYGDGDGFQFSPLVTLDICGHEMQHGITERTAGLTYSGESGALNESWSDVFGALLERYVKGQSTNTWRIGEQSYTPGTAGDALRYMDNPHAASNSGFTADDDPDHYSERYTGTADDGGVHINSGIANKAFYLLAVGGTHHRGGSMTGIGADAAAKIWYRAITSYMTSSTNFRGARTATLNAAAALYGSGSANYNAVAQAWSLCGVV